MTQPDHSTASRAVFTSAWTDFCRTSEGRYEYWRRFGDYLFQQPAREIPSELLSLPPFRPRSGRRQRNCARRRRASNVSRSRKQRRSLAPLCARCRTLPRVARFPARPRSAAAGHSIIEKLRRLVRQRERETWQSGKRRPDATGAAIPSGRGLRFVGAKSDGRFTQVTRRLRGRNIKPGGSG